MSKTDSQIEGVNAELSRYQSLASDPTTLPTLQGLTERPHAPLASTLAVALAWVVALWVRS